MFSAGGHRARVILGGGCRHGAAAAITDDEKVPGNEEEGPLIPAFKITKNREFSPVKS